jgi:hypothetical protein
MRTTTAGDLRIALSKGQATYVRVLVKDAGGTFRDLTALQNRNWLGDVQLTLTVDDPIARLSFKVAREIFKDSLAPLVSTSRLSALGGAALLRLNSDVRLEVQVLPAGHAKVATWTRLFEGNIEHVDPASGEEISVEATDNASRLKRAFIKTERVYGVWQPSRRYISGAVVVPRNVDPNAAGTVYMMALGTGTSSATTEPTWPAKGSGSTTAADGSVSGWIEQNIAGTLAETQIQMLLDDNLGVGAVNLLTPSTSAYFIRDYNQRKQSVWDAIRTIADQNGWDLRFLWFSSSFRLSFQEPGSAGGGRASPSSVYDLAPSKYQPITTFAQNIESIRNDVDVKYYDRSALTTGSNPTPSTVNAQDSASIAANGDLWCEIAEDATSQIDTSAQASALAAAVLSDLNNSPLSVGLVTEHIWFLELNDYVTVKADGLHSSADQSVAIFGMQHDFPAKGTAQTTFTLSGKPSSGITKWHGLIAQPGSAPQNRFTGPRAPVNVAVAATIGGGKITFRPPTDPKDRYDTTELHYSTTPGFTPSAATMQTVNRTGRFDLTGLTAGTTYYVRLAHRDMLGNLSDFSTQQSFTPAAVATGLNAGDITTTLLASGAVTAAKIASLTITNAQIANGTIGTAQVAAAAGITGSQLAASAGIVGTQLANSTITSAQLAANSVGATQLANNAVDAAALDPSIRTLFRVGFGSGSTTAFPGDDVTLTWATAADVDNTGGWTAGKQNWNVPTTGWYCIRVFLHLTGAVPGDRVQIRVNQAAGTYHTGPVAMTVTDKLGTGDVQHAFFVGLMSLTAGQTLSVKTSWAGTGAGARTIQASSASAVTMGSYWEIESVPS